MTHSEIEDTGFYAIYLMMGAEHYMSVVRNHEQITNGFGHTWLAEVMAHKGRLIAEFIKAQQNAQYGNAGVFVYDVVEGLGAWIVLNIEAEKHTQFKPLVDGHIDYTLSDAPFMIELEDRFKLWSEEST